MQIYENKENSYECNGLTVLINLFLQKSHQFDLSKRTRVLFIKFLRLIGSHKLINSRQLSIHFTMRASSPNPNMFLAYLGLKTKKSPSQIKNEIASRKNISEKTRSLLQANVEHITTEIIR
jgi:hypothetical protein